MKKFIEVKTSFVGYHKWKDAPSEVAFLRNEHRHIFNVKVQFEVQHSDRDLEFFLMKEVLDELIHEINPMNIQYPQGYNVGSCEMIAEDLYDNLSNQDEIKNQYSINKISVDEDGENGSILYPNL